MTIGVRGAVERTATVGPEAWKRRSWDGREATAEEEALIPVQAKAREADGMAAGCGEDGRVWKALS